MPIYLDTFILSFYLSFVGILGMLGFKALELRSGKKSWISRLADLTNHIVHDYFDRIKTFISYFNRKSALALVQWIAYHILSWARSLYIWAYKKAHAHGPSKKVIDMVRGKGEVNTNGGASFYLKKISEEDEVEEKK
jgi:hypothetical protein